MTDVNFPLALMPVVVNENTCKDCKDWEDWEDCCEGAGTLDCVDLIGEAVDGARVVWMTLITMDPALLVQTLVMEKT